MPGPITWGFGGSGVGSGGPTSGPLPIEIDHTAAALDRLAQYLREKQTVVDLFIAFAGGADSVESAFFDLYTKRSIDAGVGSVLDVIGRIIGQRRDGRDDDFYRVALRARVKADHSSGTAEEIIDVLKLVLPVAAVIQITEYQPAALTVRVDQVPLNSTFASSLALVIELLRATHAAGIYTLLEYLPNTQTDAETFAFADSADGLGFGDSTDASVGGKFSAAILI